jgi:hypothetical protein
MNCKHEMVEFLTFDPYKIKEITKAIEDGTYLESKDIAMICLVCKKQLL